jgi:hypothetical protein
MISFDEEKRLFPGLLIEALLFAVYGGEVGVVFQRVMQAL